MDNRDYLHMGVDLSIFRENLDFRARKEDTVTYILK